MNTTEMDTDFASAVRNELALIGTKHSHLQRHQRRTRAVAVGVGALALAGATTGAAVVVNGLPGETTVAPVGNVVTAAHAGTGSIDLGPAPAHAAVVVIDLNCEGQTGTVSLTTDSSGSQRDGVEIDCASTSGTIHIKDALLPKAGTTLFTITADPNTTWRATAQYATSSTTAWGVNAHGETYGVPNEHGMPDLTPAQATNGNQGYIFGEDLSALPADHSGSINVYESDGTTVIGQFRIGGGSSSTDDTK